MVSKQIEQVREFHKKFKVPVLSSFRNIPKDRFTLRYNLLKEENEEYLKACADNDKIEIADSLCDMLYVLCGTMLEHGFSQKLDEVFDEIHKSNMSKDYGDGKMVKGKNFKRPDLSKVIK